jgi:DNA-binding response OmpR family regulator
MEKILVVDDDPAIQRVLYRTFAASGFEVFLAGDAGSAMDVFRSARPQVIILDLLLPGKSGQELCQEMKLAAPYLPIIVLSATIDEVDKVLMLELGADDYVTKPFSPRELVARVRVAVRRLRQRCNEFDVLKFDDIEINFCAMELRRAGRNVPVTAQEFKILRFLLDNEERVISRSELLDKVWGYRCYPTTRTVDTHILRLRKKLEHDPNYPVHLHTVHGVGYRFVR